MTKKWNIQWIDVLATITCKCENSFDILANSIGDTKRNCPQCQREFKLVVDPKIKIGGDGPRQRG
jgi:hypothetical protein